MSGWRWFLGPVRLMDVMGEIEYLDQNEWQC